MSARRSAALVLGMLAVMVAVDLARGASTPGYYASFGLVACIVLIVVPKWLGTRWLWRDASAGPTEATPQEDG